MWLQVGDPRAAKCDVMDMKRMLWKAPVVQRSRQNLTLAGSGVVLSGAQGLLPPSTGGGQ